ncbi:hypothetical protein QNH46_07910 [Paenibacillus woosongensis]|uniref:Uncharacterized protein n=1 Tax=Paenibacillus woosongensis TaxID=307580 RepID=A0AA95KX73_9BACL|nr:hypothetical protein [Paenibacillus woosongensis]WHX50560.1 hypothetical protein QNH46_07910 [Paenibacillus woosongensis]
MYPISPIFADYIKRRDKTYKVKALIDGVEYTSANIVEFEIENILAAADEFEIGTAIPSKLIMKLRLPDAIKPNAKVIPYLALSLESMTWLDAKYPWQDMHIPWATGMTEWLPLGEFYIDSREKINDVWTYTCYDKLIMADVAYISQLNYPASQKAVFDEICSRIGFTYDSSVVINSSYQIQAGPAGYTCRQVLAYIAGANGASIYMGKDGIMRFKRFSAGEPAAVELTTADYIRVKQLNPIKTFTRIVVTYNTEDGLTYEAGSGDENHTLYLENPFMTQAQVNALHVRLNGLTYLPLQMTARGFPQFDQGDVIGFEQREGGSWIDTNVAWQDMHIPWDGIMRYTTYILRQTYSFKGGLTHKIEAPSKSDQQSEFQLEGGLTQQVNRLNQNTVRYGKPYFGVTHSRTEGIVIEREDHKSKLTLNSDKMDWQVNGRSSLYYDAQANRLKFTGHLEAATGTFSGDLSAAGGTFRGTLQGVDGTFSGSLQAATGTFSGNLSAAGGTFTGTLQGVDGTFSGTITASNISGSTITGSTLRTAASGRRIEIDQSGLRIYDSSGRERISVDSADGNDMGGLYLSGPSGSWSGTLIGLGSYLQLLASSSMMLAALGGSIYLQGPVHFTNGSSVTGLSLSIADISGLRSELESIKSELRNHTHTVNIGTHNHGNTANQNWGGTFTTSRP